MKCVSYADRRISRNGALNRIVFGHELTRSWCAPTIYPRVWLGFLELLPVFTSLRHPYPSFREFYIAPHIAWYNDTRAAFVPTWLEDTPLSQIARFSNEGK